MSSIINGISNNSDMQAMILSMFDKINNAAINAAQKVQTDKQKIINSSDFVKVLEEQFAKADAVVPHENGTQNLQNKLGMPAGMNVAQDETITKDSFKELIGSIMENLDENSDGKISKQEIENFKDKLTQSNDVETTGTLASANAGDFLKNQASNFIQKLIDKYKDNSDSILGIFV